MIQNNVINIPIRKAANKVTLYANIKPTGVKRQKCCLWISFQLIRLAVFISGFNVKIENDKGSGYKQGGIIKQDKEFSKVLHDEYVIPIKKIE